jgi:Alpha/beta hydrolase of unknown function (DUF900)
MTVYMTLRQQPVAGGVKNPSFLEGGAEPALSLRNLADDAFVTRAAGRDVLLATHGFNVDLEHGVRALGRLDAMLNLPPSAIFVGVLWPGDFWIPAVNYPFEGGEAKDCGRRVARFCNSRLGKARSFSFVSHSLGARVVLEAVKNLGRKARSVCVTAAAVDDNCLSKEYAAAFANADVISVLASRKDHVLELAYPIGDPIADLLSLHQSPFRSALGRHGPPEPIGATVPPWQIPDSDNYDHGDYMPPSDTATTFPDPNGKWVRTSGFMRQAFEEVSATWPP